jgi:hypothetical protein
MLRVKFGGTYLSDEDVNGLNGFTRTLVYESDRKVFRLKTGLWQERKKEVIDGRNKLKNLPFFITELPISAKTFCIKKVPKLLKSIRLSIWKT